MWSGRGSGSVCQVTSRISYHGDLHRPSHRSVLRRPDRVVGVITGCGFHNNNIFIIQFFFYLWTTIKLIKTIRLILTSCTHYTIHTLYQNWPYRLDWRSYDTCVNRLDFLDSITEELLYSSGSVRLRTWLTVTDPPTMSVQVLYFHKHLEPCFVFRYHTRKSPSVQDCQSTTKKRKEFLTTDSFRMKGLVNHVR